MRQKFFIFALGVFALTTSTAFAQAARKLNPSPKQPAPVNKAEAKKRFVLDVVRTAVALPQPDAQDRLRVLAAASNVAAQFAPEMARQFSREGTRLESDMVAHGQKPAVSMLSVGRPDCEAAAQFVDNVPPTGVAAAEQSLVAAITLCPKQTLESARRKLQTALDQGTLAARPMLALIEASGPSSRWSQTQFSNMYSALPKNADDGLAEAPNFAAMYVRMASAVDKDIARNTGLKFLEWLGKLRESGERNLSLNMTTDAMQKTLGAEAYEEALRSNVMARQAAQMAGQPGEVKPPEEESVSVLMAMENKGKDRADEISKMSPSLRAREAAAHGFASGTGGDRKMADRYFDIAFSAVDEVWSKRSPEFDAPAVVEEVSEAAAQVDAIAALQRAQRLQDPSAQAIGMLAVARVVVGQP